MNLSDAMHRYAEHHKMSKEEFKRLAHDWVGDFFDTTFDNWWTGKGKQAPRENEVRRAFERRLNPFLRDVHDDRLEFPKILWKRKTKGRDIRIIPSIPRPWRF